MTTDLPLATDEAEALRRMLYGWTPRLGDDALLEGVSQRLGPPTQTPDDRLGLPPGTFDGLLSESRP